MPTLTAVAAVTGVPMLDAVAPVPREMLVDDVCDNVRSGKPDIVVCCDVAVAPVSVVLAAVVIDGA